MKKMGVKNLCAGKRVKTEEERVSEKKSLWKLVSGKGSEKLMEKKSEKTCMIERMEKKIK